MTSFDTIYKRFLQKIEDYKILNMKDNEVVDMLNGWMISAASKMKTLRSNLSDRDDELACFNVDLLDIEIEILALQMVEEWLEPQVNSTLLTSQFFGGKDEKFYAQANQLSQLTSLKQQSKIRARKLIRDYTYQNYDFSVS